MTTRALVFLALGVLANASGKSPRPESRMSFLDNGVIRVGVDLNLGGAITWLSKSGGENIVNNWDLGRQIQMSYYSGPAPFSVGDKKPAKHWEHLGWNPIQAGDDFGHGSRTLASWNFGNVLHTKCIPMQWPLDDVPADCLFETTIQLEGNTVQLFCHATLNRADRTVYPARFQELPAVYVNAPFHRLVSYTGAKPFTEDALTEIKRPADRPGQWAQWLATERWAALVNDEGRGLGLWNPSCIAFTGGFDGTPGPNDTRAQATGYLAAQAQVMLDHDMQHDYYCELILGSVDEIRRHVRERSPVPEPPRWDFTRGREDWRLVNAKDEGWRSNHFYHVLTEEGDPQIISPLTFFYAADAPVMTIRAKLKTPHRSAQVFWRRLEEGKSVPGGVLDFPIKGDGELRDFKVRLADSPDWRGAIVELRLDPMPAGGRGDWVDLRSIKLGK